MLPDITADKRISSRIVVTLAIGIVGAVLLLASSLANAVPSVRWNPGSVYEEISPGVPRTLTVSLVAQDNVPATTVRVVPELQSYVSVAPSTIGSLTKGQTIQVTLTLQASATVPLFTAKDGVLQLRQQSSPNKTIAQPLSIKLLVVPVGLPPDPGEAGKATVEGIDSNGNGVRDDIERWIAYSFTASEKQRAGLLQQARADQQILIAGKHKDLQLALSASAQDDMANACLIYIVGIDQRITLGRVLFAETLNTRARSLAYLDYNDLLRGKVLGGAPFNKRDGCTFNPDLLRN